MIVVDQADIIPVTVSRGSIDQIKAAKARDDVYVKQHVTKLKRVTLLGKYCCIPANVLPYKAQSTLILSEGNYLAVQV